MNEYRKLRDEPTMSDKTLLMNVEDLINMCLGTADQNVVNFKVMQTVLHIIARQMRLLEQDVEIKLDELGIKPGQPGARGAQYATRTEDYGEDEMTPVSSAGSREEFEGGGVEGGGRDDRGGGRDTAKDQPGDKSTSKDRGRDMADKGGSRDQKGTSKGKGRDIGSPEGTRGDSGSSEGRRGDKGSSEGRGEDRGSPKGRGEDRGSLKGRGGERDSPESRKGGRGSPESKKGDRGSPESKRGDRGSPESKRGDRGSPESKKGDRGSPESKRGDKGSPESRRGDRGSPGGRGGDKGGSEGKGGKGSKGSAQEKGADRGRAKEKRSGKDRSRGYDDEGRGGQYADQDKDYDQDDERRGGRDDGRGGGRDDGRGGGRDDGRGGGRDDGRGGGRDDGRGGGRDDGPGGGRGGDREGSGRAGGRGARADRRGTPGPGSETISQRRSMEGSRTSITVSEAERKGGKGPQDKVLVVGKERTQPGSRVARVGSIEVVTASQFALLEKAVQQLQDMVGPVPMPALPDNVKLRQDLAKGTATLPETMQAMQLNARVQAAENCLTRLASLLTQLAAAGALPEEVAQRVGEVRAELQNVAEAVAEAGRPVSGPGGASSAQRRPQSAERRVEASPARFEGASPGVTSTGASVPGAGPPGAHKVLGMQPTSGMTLVSSRPESARRGAETAPGSSWPSSAQVGHAGLAAVTRPEMDDVLQIMKENLLKEISVLTSKVTHAAETATNTSKSVADKLEIALKVDKRITKLFAQTADYSQQLSGFDSGVTTQMASFQDQMAQMRNELKAGLEQMEQANNNAETAAIMELTERYESLVIELDNTLHSHQNLTILQRQLTGELKSLVECVEMLREQKADKDEVFDGLKDKADISRLAGLLHEDYFVSARKNLEKALEVCYDKFQKQDSVWLAAIKDLSTIAAGKAELMQLQNFKDIATDELREMKDTLQHLLIMLGEPKAAILTRLLAKGAVCGACLAPALMEPTDKDAGRPHALPVLRPSLNLEPCGAELRPESPPDTRTHICHRWAGGSHTLVEGAARARPPPLQPRGPPTNKYAGYGTDGKLYMLEEELLPCLECNKMSTDVPPQPPPSVGAGDQLHLSRQPRPPDQPDQPAAPSDADKKVENIKKISDGHIEVCLISEPPSQHEDYEQHPLKEMHV